MSAWFEQVGLLEAAPRFGAVFACGHPMSAIAAGAQTSATHRRLNATNARICGTRIRPDADWRALLAACRARVCVRRSAVGIRDGRRAAAVNGPVYETWSPHPGKPRRMHGRLAAGASDPFLGLRTLSHRGRPRPPPAK